MKFQILSFVLSTSALVSKDRHVLGDIVEEEGKVSDISFSRDYDESEDHLYQEQGKLSISEFQKLLYTEVNDEIQAIAQATTSIENFHGRNLGNDDPLQHLWEHMVNHAWISSRYLQNEEEENDDTETSNHPKFSSRLLISGSHAANGGDINFPFLVCSRSPLLQSGIQRLAPMLQFSGAQMDDAIIISNDEHQSCFQISTTYSSASILDSSISNDEYVIIPMADMMKISMNTFNQIEEDTWAIPTPDEQFRLILRDEHDAVEWERIIRVGLTPGLMVMNETDLIIEAHSVLDTVKQMGQNGSYKNHRRLANEVDEAKSTRNKKMVASISDVFSLTSSVAIPQNNTRRAQIIAAGRNVKLSRSLQNGIESNHFCRNMFDHVEIRPNDDMKEVDIVLNPQSNHDTFMKQSREDAESSASNKDCVASLIIGLSIHPHVLSIEADLPITPDDFEAQWITQSNTKGKRPFFDRGLTGAGQIVSVSDSGLDINHRYFGPTSNGVFQSWIYSERKVVRYDHSSGGDKNEPFQGHGTRVAGVIAGSAGDEGDGIAKDAKIHIFDLKKEGGKLAAPKPEELFSSIYNKGKGAKITNGSWSSGYRPYTFRCRIYDSLLRDNYDDILFVASAGNAANDVAGKTKNTIGDPSSCKNILSVGASQSDGRLFPGDKGRDFLADFSSRGPTADGRMKPDLVAPGYRILAPRAHAKSNNYDETYETFGTSFSAPVVSGNAALIRQYFEEGWFPCGSKGCNKKNGLTNPSGSLIRAILMNGAIQTIRNVQKVPAGPITESVTEYDNNAGMGLINMANSLPLQGVNDMTAIAVNNKLIGDGDSDYIIVKTKACSRGGDLLRTTLSWYDPPGQVNCASCLLNDLDLIVEKMTTANGQIEKTFYPNGLNGKDKKNNVERVRVTANVPSQTFFKISVKATNLATRNQKYSLIITGCFDFIEEKKGLQCIAN